MATGTPTNGPDDAALSSDSGTEEVRLEQFQYDDGIVRLFATATIVWGIVATLVGLIVAVLLVLPSITGGLPWFTFARLRPLHTNAAIFAFAGNGIFAAVYYSTQRLCKARMWSDVPVACTFGVGNSSLF